MNLAAWEKLLTDLENDLDASEEAVRNGSATLVPEWEAPAELGDMPAGFQGRVENLVQRIGVLSTFVKYQLAALDADIEHAHKHEQQKGGHNRAVALFLDASV